MQSVNALPHFNKYLVFVDEAGDHLLRPNDKDFPLFVLAFCLIERAQYADFLAPQMLRLKLKYFQDSHVILHERDIRKASGHFSFLTNTTIRQSFLDDLSNLVRETEFKIIASVIRKDKLQTQYTTPESPYDLGAEFGLERLLLFLNRRAEKLPTTIAFESRGKKEDMALELSFLRITNKPKYAGRFQIKILPKISNCCGLQLADLIARPIGRYVLDSSQTNRAYEIIQGKMDAHEGKVEGYGLKVFP